MEEYQFSLRHEEQLHSLVQGMIDDARLQAAKNERRQDRERIVIANTGEQRIPYFLGGEKHGN